MQNGRFFSEERNKVCKNRTGSSGGYNVDDDDNAADDDGDDNAADDDNDDGADDDNDDDDDDGGEVVTLQRKFLRLGSILSFCPDEKSKNPTRWLRGRGSSANSSRPEFEFLIRTLPPLLQLRRLHIESNIC